MQPTELELVAGTAVRFEKRFHAVPRTPGQPARERVRFCTLRIERSRQVALFGAATEYVLTITRGRIDGRAPTTKQLTFDTLAHALETWGERCARRRRRGYREREQDA
jgi:predicted DNA-binding WGR domain protein